MGHTGQQQEEVVIIPSDSRSACKSCRERGGWLDREVLEVGGWVRPVGGGEDRCVSVQVCQQTVRCGFTNHDDKKYARTLTKE